MMAKRIVAETRRIVVRENGFGWYKVQYKDVARDGMVVETNIRPSMWNEILSEVDSNKKYKTVEGVFYHKWRTETTAGNLYSTRRQVEGLLKASIERGDTAFTEELQEVLKKGDEAVYKWHQKWLSEHSNEEIEEYYDYETDESGIPKHLLDMVF